METLAPYLFFFLSYSEEPPDKIAIAAIQYLLTLFKMRADKRGIASITRQKQVIGIDPVKPL